MSTSTYRGRLAPSPTGFLHIGHARTFWIAQQRCDAANGVMVLRNDDIDAARCRMQFVDATLEDLRWFGCSWQEGPDIGGSFAPYSQSERLPIYRSAFEKLKSSGALFPCTCSRKEVLNALSAPHQGEEEPVYPGTCRSGLKQSSAKGEKLRINWRYRVPDGLRISFQDGFHGEQEFTCGADIGDFVVWRHDDLPSYQLSCVVDDALMRITEVVRGEDLLKSTARQLLLYDALGFSRPAFYHCPLIKDANGVRLAKRHDALSLRAMREQGLTPELIRKGWGADLL